MADKPAPKPTTETITRTKTGRPETPESLRSTLADKGRKRPS